MEYLKLENVSKSYGEKVLFDEIALTISKGSKIALIAKNGSGKSTLLRVISGNEAAEGERAKVFLNKSIKTAFLDQDPQFDAMKTVLEVLLSSDNPSIKAVREYEKAIVSGDEDKIQDAIAKIEDLKAWDTESRVKEILYKLKLDDLDQLVGTLSGGQEKRLALAKIIIDEPDFLILDEPTNHLDVEMIEWLEKYLQSSQLTIFMVTHDRYFLERVCNEIIELDKGLFFSYKGNYSDYLEKKALRTQNESVNLDKAKKLLAKELEWVRRQPKARSTKAKSRVDSFTKLDEHVSSIKYDTVFEIDIETERLGTKILEFYDASKSFDSKVILKEFWYKFKKGERIGISGSNGTGKSTFIKLLTGESQLTSGKRVIGETVAFGHYKQDGIELKEDKRVIDVIRDIAEYIPLKKGLKLTAARLLENFMFAREQQQVYVSQLSGGERKRLHLLSILIKNPNFLILDEPTNDLDVLTLNVLEDYLMQFPGCLVIVSHDRYFMDKLVDHMFIFQGDGVLHDYNGTYSQWKEQANQLKDKRSDSESADKSPKSTVPAEAEEKRKLSYKEKMEIQSIEKRLKEIENRQKELSEAFMDTTLSNEKLQSLSKEAGMLSSEAEKIELRWLELAEFE